VERAAGAGDRGAQGTLLALRSLSTQLSGAQLGITITNLAVGFLAEPAISSLVAGPLTAAGVPDGAVPGISIALGLGLGTALTMILGELVPKNLAIARPLATAGATQGFQRAFTTAMALPIRLLNGTANRVVRWFGIEPQEELASARTPEELASLVRRSAREGVLERPTAHLLERSLAFGAKTAGDIKTPRVRAHFVDSTAPVADVIALTRQTGHSRFPVAQDSVDDVVGIVHVKQAVGVPVADRGAVTVAEVMSQPIMVPATLELDPLLALLRGHGLQMAVVVDEYGGTEGVVTLEDVVEEIVGDIADEHDRPGVHGRRHRDGSWSLSGLLRPDEVRDLTGVALPAGEDYDTVAGLVLDRLGRMPEAGETVTVTLPPPTELPAGDQPGEDVRQAAVLTVERLEGLRVARIALTVVDLPAEDER
jgi:CBS domain containing-hemolysin-like protein